MPRVPILLAACLLLSGCFVFEELDSGREIMEHNSPNGGRKAKAEAAAAAADEEKPPTGSQWWSSAKSIDRRDAAEADDGDPKQLVSCRIGGDTRFMRRGDCLSQGGAPKG